MSQMKQVNAFCLFLGAHSIEGTTLYKVVTSVYRVVTTSKKVVTSVYLLLMFI